MRCREREGFGKGKNYTENMNRLFFSRNLEEISSDLNALGEIDDGKKTNVLQTRTTLFRLNSPQGAMKKRRAFVMSVNKIDPIPDEYSLSRHSILHAFTIIICSPSFNSLFNTPSLKILGLFGYTFVYFIFFYISTN